MLQAKEKQNERSHTRPKIRKRNIHHHDMSHGSGGLGGGDDAHKSQSKVDMVDELLEKTRQRLDNALYIGEQLPSSSSTRVGLLKGLLETMDNLGSSNDDLTDKMKTGVTLLTDKNEEIQLNKNTNIESTHRGKVEGILKHDTKYQSKDINNNYRKENKSMVRMEVDKNVPTHHQQNKPMNESNIMEKSIPTTSTLVKDIIVERLNPKAESYPNEKSLEDQICNSTEVEGYTPKQKHEPTKQKQKREEKIKKDSFGNDNIVEEGSNLLQEAHPDNNQSIFETDMEFKCMTDAEYKSAVEVATALGMTVNEFLTQQQEIINNEKKEMGNIMETEMKEEANKENIIETDDGESFDGDDQDDFFSFFVADSDDEDTDISVSSNDIKPSSFMILWGALSNWITPKSIIVLQKYRSDLFDKDHDKYNPVVGEISNTNSNSEYNYNDVAVSRCEGLMSMIKMNLSKALSELEYNSNDENLIQMAYTRLGEFIQTFDFAESMVKLDSKMWLALTVLLLDIILPKREIFDDKIPSSAIAIGISLTEYVYLTRTAVPTLSKGAII